MFNRVTISTFVSLENHFNELKMNNFVCEITGCKSAGHIYTSKYALEKHNRNNHPDTSDTILSGKRKRVSVSSTPISSDDNNNDDQATFSGLCVCGSLMRDNWNFTRHVSKCPVVVPSKETLESINYKTLRVPVDAELVHLQQAMAPLSPSMKASLCLNTGICIPGFFPIICNTNKGLLTSTYNEFGLTGDIGLKTLWEIVEDSVLSHEESFLIKFHTGREVFVPSKLLVPPKTRPDLHICFKTSLANGCIEVARDTIRETVHEPVHLTILDDEQCGVDHEEEDGSGHEVLRLRGGTDVDQVIPRRVVANCNRYLHPRLWSNDEIKTKIRISRDMFLDEFCPSLASASTQNARRDHESKCFLFLVKMAGNPSFDDLASDFMITKTTARNWFLDVLFALFLTCPHVPSLFNDENSTDAEIDSLLESVREEQSPYVKHIVSAFRSEDGRPVTLLNDDYTALLMEGVSSEDFVKVQDMHSGRRGDKWAMYVSALVDGNGKVVAIPSGGGIGKSPRGGDCAANSELLTRELEQQTHRSFNRVLQGTRNNAVLLNTDVGFVEKGPVNLHGRVTTSQRCEDLGIPHIYPFRPKDKRILSYQPQPIHRLTIEDNPDQDPILAANSSRISTALRQSVEQLFSMKNIWKILKGRINQAFFRPLGAALCIKYMAKHPSGRQDLGPEWHDMSLMFVVFASSCGLQNWFGSGYQRSTSRPVEQVRLAHSLLQRISLPNVLSDPDLNWGPTVRGIHVSVDPCSVANSPSAGIITTQLGNNSGLEALGLPQIQPGEGQLLREPSGGGDFCLNRGEGLLSLERQRELRQLAESGHYASLSEYMEEAVLLPTSTEVKAFRQANMPRGWAAQISANSNFPPWRGSGTVVTLKIPSHFKNNRLASNMHTVVLFFSDQPATHNGFTGAMQNFFASWCSCKMGSRTNTLCAHRSGAMIALMARWFFRTRVTPMFKVIDIWRHPNFQPISTGGVPAGNRDRSVLSQASPCRPRRSADKRAASNRRFDPAYRPNQPRRATSMPHQPPTPPNQPAANSMPPPPPPDSPSVHHPPPQSSNASPSSSPNSQLPSATTSGPPPPPSYAGSINHPSGLGGLLNSNNCCYVNSVVQGLTAISAHDHINWLDPCLVSQPALLHLFEVIYDLCLRRRNPSSPPFSAAALRDAVNNFLRNIPNSNPVNRFQPGRYECSVELLHEILAYVNFNQTIVDFPVAASCRICGNRVVQTVNHNKMLTLCVAPSNTPVSLTDLYNNRLADRQHFQDEVLCHCTCNNSCNNDMGCSTAVKLQGQLEPTPGNVIILSLDRTGIGLGVTGNNKVLTELSEVDHLNGYQLVAVLCHVERTRVVGHWVSFVKKSVTNQPVWWKLDDCRPVTHSNPFLTQCNPNRQSTPDDFTIDVLILKQ